MEKEQNELIKTALLVEDERIIQRIICTQLSSLGYEVDTANDATTAINKLGEKTYNLIVTDLGLPDKPGIEVIKAARQSEMNPGTPIIVSTAQLSNQADIETYLKLGADAVLIKPYSETVLEKTIHDCQVIPSYQRKLFYQIKGCADVLEDKIQHLQTKEEFACYMDDIQNLLTKTLCILQEYQKWAELEKLNGSIQETVSTLN